MYKFVMIQGSCGNPYDLGSAEKQTNKMAQSGYELVEAFQSTTTSCTGQKSVLVLVFKEGKTKQ